MLLQPNPFGVISSQVFPGLHLSVPALLSGELATVLTVVQAGIATAAHQAFVAQLASKLS